MRIRRGLAALLALLMLLTLAPSAMMEEEVSRQDLEGDWAVEPEAGGPGGGCRGHRPDR